MRLLLIPIGYRRQIILKRQIFPAALPAQALNSYLQIIFKPYRVQYMPAVLTYLGLIRYFRVIFKIVKSRMRCAEFTILYNIVIIPIFIVTIRTAKVVFFTSS